MEHESHAPIPRLDWIDYGRLVCALWVMLFHYLVTGADPRISHGMSDFGLPADLLRFGTAPLFVFMLMSGLVITLVAQRQDAATFVTHRMARVYPTFILAMTITALVSHLGPERLHVTATQYLANFAINAPAFGHRYVDAVYWSLVVEIVFYCAVLVVIMGGWIRHLQKLVVVWIALQVLCAAASWRVPLLGREYCFLAAGAVFALLYQRRNQRLNPALLLVSLALCIRCAVIYAGKFAFDPAMSAVWTVCVFALFLFMRDARRPLPYARRIGSLTYPLYLLHFKAGLVLLYLFVDEANKWLVVAGISLFMLAAAAAIDDIMEFRLRRLWVGFLRGTVVRPFAWWDRRAARSGSEMRVAKPFSSAPATSASTSSAILSRDPE